MVTIDPQFEEIHPGSDEVLYAYHIGTLPATEENGNLLDQAAEEDTLTDLILNGEFYDPRPANDWGLVDQFWLYFIELKDGRKLFQLGIIPVRYLSQNTLCGAWSADEIALEDLETVYPDIELIYPKASVN